ncbi:ECF transporter S component [Sporolactobacillus sp. Y61]|uniref:ECF transporter S component n=1 Tax=Sporolactobacillus sp. Y61 TaxID=3160863 RepID=A0AAU8IIK1_9BACL
MRNRNKGNKLAWMSIFIALSVVGAYIKIPAVPGSIALDSFPSLVAAAVLGGPTGALTAAFGHLVSAYLGGFPLGPFHLFIAAEMALLVSGFVWLYNHVNQFIAGAFFLLGNAILAPLPFWFIISKGFYLTIVPPLFIGSLLNIGIALLTIPRVYAAFQVRWGKR